jgi:hypothetical protein
MTTCIPLLTVRISEAKHTGDCARKSEDDRDRCTENLNHEGSKIKACLLAYSIGDCDQG